MKKIKLLLSVLFLAFIIVGCEKNNSDNKLDTTSNSVSSTLKSDKDESTQSDTNNINDSDLPDEESLIQTYTDELSKLTDSTISSVEYQDYSKGTTGDIDLKVLATMSDGRTLEISVQYLTVIKSWLLFEIRSEENSHPYYFTDDLKFIYDIYDYSTDKLIPKEKFQTKMKFKKIEFVVPSHWQEQIKSNSYTFSNSDTKTYISILASKSSPYSLNKIWDVLKTNYDNYEPIEEKKIKISGKSGKCWNFKHSLNGSSCEGIFCLVKYKKQMYGFYTFSTFVLDDTIFNAVLDSVKWKK